MKTQKLERPCPWCGAKVSITEFRAGVEYAMIDHPGVPPSGNNLCRLIAGYMMLSGTDSAALLRADWEARP